MSIKEKLRAVQSAVSAIEKQFGKGAIMALGETRDLEPVLTISTGAPSLDAAMGCGGYPRGRIVEVFGVVVLRAVDKRFGHFVIPNEAVEKLILSRTPSK